MASLGRIVIFLFSATLTAFLAGASLAMAALWALLQMSGRDLSLNRATVPYWPEFLPPIDVYAWGAPFYLAGGVALLFVALPLSLALLEEAYLALPRSTEVST
ncbi:MAG TPA: hypothetical protein VM492_12130 [Sumerlaeia bacterium]|nr:hypothetical protein [Sumerlaeia bacterium]